MDKTFDVVIVGGGVMGSAVAYFLAGPVGFSGRILVVERDASYADSTTARSVGGIRQQFSTPENIRMSMFGAEFVRHADEHLSVDGEAPGLPFVENGYLFLASPAGMDVLRHNHAVQRAENAQVMLLDPGQLVARFPWLNADGLAGGSFGFANEGWTDPHGLLQAFKRKARSLGVTYVQDEVVAFRRQGTRIASASLKNGGEIGCGIVVDAAGPRAGAVAALAGVELPVRPRKRFVYVFDCRTPLQRVPLTIDPSGVYVRPEGAGFICGVSPPEDQDPDCLDLDLDYRLFEDVVWPTLAARVPAFEAIRLARAWAGTYDYNSLDQNAILGPHPEIGNLHFIAGFSGHGLQQAPAAGRAVAELVAHGVFRSLDLSRFSYDRIARNEPLRELNVV